MKTIKHEREIFSGICFPQQLPALQMVYKIGTCVCSNLPHYVHVAVKCA